MSPFTSLHDHPSPYVLDPTGADIPGEAARLRALGDLVPVVMPGGIRAWLPTRQRVLEPLLTDDRVTRNPRAHWDAWNNGWLEEHPEAHWILGLMGESMFSAHGLDHARLRTLVAPAFTDHRTKALQPIIDRIVGELLDDLATQQPGAVTDLRAGFAHPLPMRVMCEMFDVDVEGAAAVQQFIETLLTGTSSAQETVAAMAALREAFARLIARKRANPGDDLTSALVQAQAGDDRLSDSEVIDTLLVVLSAGHETTVHVIGNAIVSLLQHPDQLALVRAGEVTWDAVVEEALRFAPSVAVTPLRFAVEDITVGGVTVRAGEAILAAFGYYAWDTEQHGPDAARFDVTRVPTRHMAFGHGVHRCIGATLARSKTRTALAELFARFPDLALDIDAQLSPLVSFVSHGWAEIKVTLVP